MVSEIKVSKEIGQKSLYLKVIPFPKRKALQSLKAQIKEPERNHKLFDWTSKEDEQRRVTKGQRRVI